MSLSEIEKLLLEDGELVSEKDFTRSELLQEKWEVSEMLNKFCITCGVELEGENRKFASCQHCGAFLVRANFFSFLLARG